MTRANEVFPVGEFMRALQATASPFSDSGKIAKFLGRDRMQIQKAVPKFERRQAVVVDRSFKPFRLYLPTAAPERLAQPKLVPPAPVRLQELADLLAESKIKAGHWDPRTGGEKSYRSDVARLIGRLGVHWDVDLTPEVVRSYIHERRKVGTKEATIKAELLRLEAILAFGRRTKRTESSVNPVEILKEKVTSSLATPVETVKATPAPEADPLIKALAKMADALGEITAALRAKIQKGEI